MSLLLFLSAPSSQAKNHAKNTLMTFLYVAITGLAVFLAIMDMSALDGTATKIWLFLLAICVPELYVILHGISSSSLGLPFFSRTLLEFPSSTHLPDSVFSSSTPPALASEMHKAAARIKTGAHAAASALSSVGSALDSINS